MSAPEHPSSASNPPPLTVRKRMNWVVFFAVLLTPTLATIVAALLDAKNGDVAPTVAFLGAGLSGITCGVMLGRHLGPTLVAKIALSIVFAFVLTGASVAMNCFGCLASGYKLQF